MLQLSLYSPMAQAIMKKMSYNAQNPICLRGGSGILTASELTLTETQLEDWRLYHHTEKSLHGLGHDPDTPLKQLTQKLKSRSSIQASTSRVHEDIDLP